MMLLAASLAPWFVAAVGVGRGRLERLSFFSLLLSIRESSAGAEDSPAQFIINYSSGKSNVIVMSTGINKR
jgi:hypothetical protein